MLPQQQSVQVLLYAIMSLAVLTLHTWCVIGVLVFLTVIIIVHIYCFMW